MNTMKKILRLKNESAKVFAIKGYFVTNPKIIILEATFNLATESEALTQKSLTHLVQGRTSKILKFL